MIDLVAGILPSADTIKAYKNGQLDDMEEAARLFYVGMTRARHELHLLSYRFKSKSFDVSPFVEDVHRLVTPDAAKRKVERHRPAVTARASIPPLPITENMRVSHTAFGPGTVLHLVDDVLEISFDQGMKKQLSLQVCSENALLEIL